LLRAAVAIALVWLVACQGPAENVGFDPSQSRNPRPAWVDRIEERVQNVPAEARPSGARLSTPTQWPQKTAVDAADGGAQVPRGLPQDLTAPFVDPAVAAAAGTTSPGAPRNVTTQPAGPGAETIATVAPANAAATGETSDPSQAALGQGGVTVHVHNVDTTEAAQRQPSPPSSLEVMYSGSAAGGAVLRQFGYEFFEGDIGGDAVGIIPSDHVVVPGDELRVVMTGTFKDEIFKTVEPDGTIVVPDGGAVVVAGRRLSELAEVIKRQIEERANRRDFYVDVSPGRLRGFRVHVVGEVEQPGIVEVRGRASVITALAAAKGPRKTGSLRAVELRREGRRVAVVDLYEFLLTGETAGIQTLRADDVIYVPTIGATVAVTGAVRRQGIYEIHRETTVDEAIRLASGLTAFTFMPSAQIERTIGGRGRARIDVGLDDAGRQTRMSDGEVLIVGTIDQERQPQVEIAGQVSRPGRYPFRDGMTIGDLLRAADGLTVDAFLPQAFLSRQIGESGEVTIVPERQALGTSRRVLVVDLERALLGDPQHDVELRPLDHLAVRARGDAAAMPTVEILGAVRNPGTYELTAGLTVAQLVAIAGNVVPEAWFDEAELIRRVYDPASRGITVRRFRFDLGKALREGGEADPALANGDSLMIRRLHSEKVRVKIEGHVRFPGEYDFARGQRISDLVAVAGGPLDGADLRAARFTRESVRNLQQDRFDHLRTSTEATFQRAFEKMVASGYPAESTAARIALDQTRMMLAHMQSWQVEGRIVIPFTRDDFPGSPHDLILENGDRLFVPPLQQTVSIIGSVFNPGAFVAEPGLRVADLLARSGGVAEDGDTDRVYIVRADGTVQGPTQSHYRLTSNTEVLPGDVVMVPRRPIERTFGNQLTDFLYAGRRLAEMALLLGNLSDVDNLQFTSLLQEPRLDSNVDALQRSLIQSSTQGR
jgi:protein involved in polysaccharide export with SLBB domain